MTAKDILFVVVIPLILAEVGSWCGWFATRVLQLAARLRYGDTARAAVRLEEWSGDLDRIPGQLTKLAYAAGQLIAGTAASARRKTGLTKLGAALGLVAAEITEGALHPGLAEALAITDVAVPVAIMLTVFALIIRGNQQTVERVFVLLRWISNRP